MPSGALRSYSCNAHAGECVVHVQSELRVGATFSYSSALHASVAWHGKPSSASEKFFLASHGTHWRSEEAEPMVEVHWPFRQVAHGTHCAAPGAALNVSAVQGAQTKSLDVDAAAAVYPPAGHGARTGSHAEPSLWVEKEDPIVWAPASVNCRDAEVVGGSSQPSRTMIGGAARADVPKTASRKT
jgi:hypothetical protein